MNLIIYLQHPLILTGIGLFFAALAVKVIFLGKDKSSGTARKAMHLLLVLAMLVTVSGALLSWQGASIDAVVEISPTAVMKPAQTAQQAFESGLEAEKKIDYKNALLHYNKALELVPDKPEYLLAAGRTARKFGKFIQAQDCLERLLQLREAEGKDTAAFAEAQNELAQLYYDQGKYAKAESLYQSSLEIRKVVFGNEAPEVAQSLNKLAAVYREQGKYEAAEPLCERALAIQEHTLGKKNPAVAETLNNLALLYRVQRKYEEAEPLHQRALAIREQAFGKEHPAVAETLNNLGSLYYQQGRYNEAEPLYQRALKIREQFLGKEHPAVAETLNNLALIYKAQRKYTEAESLYQRSIAILTAAVPDGHLNITRYQANYDELKRKMAEQEQQQ